MPQFDSVLIIAFEYSPFPGGIATYATSIARVLGAQHPVEVIAPVYDDQGPADDHVPTHRCLKHMSMKPRGVMAALAHVRKSPQTTLVHCADVRAALIGLLGRMLFGKRYTVMVHGSEVSKLQWWKLWRPDHLAIRLAYRMAERIMANSEATAAIFVANMGSSVPCRVAHLGVEPQWFEPPPLSSDHSSLDTALKSQKLIFCTVGRIERRKGHTDVVRALGSLKLEGNLPDFIYVIVGKVIDSAYAREIQDLARSCNVTVLMAGSIDAPSLRLLYRQATVHVLSSRALSGKIEGFGLVVLEAAAQGCPSVATLCGGIPEIIEHKRTGYLVEEGDIKALEDGIVYFALRSEKSANRKIRIDHAAEFTWEKCARNSFLDLIAV